jgi:putative Ca2+/H+ antiporter (TMEM165/GDT1 family)
VETIWSSFFLVAISEMGDKTQLLAFSLAARFKSPWAIMAGILTATVFNHALASSLGSWVSAHVPARVMAGLLAAAFIGFGLWTLRPDSFEGKESQSGRGAFLTTVVLFFLAEMGDKTQLATMALAAKFGSVLWVTMGTTLGMLASDGLAVFVGEKLAERVSMTWVRRAAAGLFFLFGVLSAVQALQAGTSPS